MSGLDDFVDLLGSGDEEKIKCVLMPTLGGAVGTGLVFSGTGLGAAVAAVLGGLVAYGVAYRLCGAASTKGSFQQMLSAGRLPKPVVEDYEKELRATYRLSSTAFGTKTSGTSGPVTWSWVDGKANDDNSTYSAVLVLRQTNSQPINFTSIKRQIWGARRPRSGGRWCSRRHPAWVVEPGRHRGAARAHGGAYHLSFRRLYEGDTTILGPRLDRQGRHGS